MADKLPGNGVFGWLGRQVGYVKKAVTTKPAALPHAKPQPKPKAGTGPRPATAPQPETPPTVVYREGRVEEAEHPTQPGLKLRRTVIDEVIVEGDEPRPSDSRHSPPRGEP